MIAGVLSANELALLRTRPQRTQLYLAIPEYKTIYTARENGAPADDDNVISVTFDGGVGTLTSVLPGMTLLVGSSAGAWDVGIARIRDSALDLGGGTGTLFIGITSEIDWANDLYLTVIDDYGLWPKHPYVSAVATYMDYGVVYTNQNVYGDPVPIMSTHAVVELVGGSATVHFDASDSYNCIGTPDHYDYEWYVDNVLVGAAATIDIGFAATGTYTIRLEVTADYAIGSPIIEKTSVAVRYVIVHDHDHPLNASFMLDSCEGDFDSGGWSYRVTMNAKASETYVRDRTLCLLVARDWYGDTEQSVGPLDGRENIICVGWVDGESIRRSNDKSLVSFDVQGPAFWLGCQEGFPTGIDDTTAAPTDWSHIQALDPRKGLFSFLHWRTTSTAVMDCYITSDNHRLATTYTPAGTLLEQLRSIAERVNAKTVCDRYGRLFCEIDTQFIDPALRVPPTFPVVQTISNRDWRDEITIERRIVNTTGQVDLSGVYWSGTIATSAAIFSLSPGHIPSHYGEKRQIQRIALDDQAEANLLAGLWHGYLNNEYPHVDVPMSSNYRAVDIAPRMFVQMNLAAGDTPRGLTWTNKKLIPRRVSFNYDAREALLLTDITFESEAFPSDAIIGDPPIEPPDPPPTVTPVPPTLCNDPTALNFGGLAPCIYPETADIVVVMTEGYLAYSDDVFTNIPDTPANITWNDITPTDLAGKMRDFVFSSSGECWLAVESVASDAYEGIWYSPNLMTDAFSRILSADTARAQSGYTGGAFSQYSVCLVGGECYAALRGATRPNGSDYYYWHGTSSMSSGHWLPLGAPNISIGGEGTSCTDGVHAIYSGSAFAVGVYAIDMTDGTFYRWAGGTTGGDAPFASETYVMNNVFSYIALLSDPHTVIYPNAVALPLIENGGSLFWINTSEQLLQDASSLSAANDGGGFTGVFSTAGASSGRFCIGDSSSTILWVASTNHASNSRRDMAITLDGGSTWYDIAGDWAVSVAVWDGGSASMTATIKLGAI